MRIDWMGMTKGRVKMPRIVWTCDCGHQNFATGEFSRTLWCDEVAGCGARFEVEISALPDRQLQAGPDTTGPEQPVEPDEPTNRDGLVPRDQQQHPTTPTGNSPSKDQPMNTTRGTGIVGYYDASTHAALYGPCATPRGDQAVPMDLEDAHQRLAQARQRLEAIRARREAEQEPGIER